MKRHITQVYSALKAWPTRTKRVVVLAGLTLSITGSCWLGYDTVASAISRTTPVPVTLESSTKKDFTRQIQVLLQYESMEGLSFSHAYDKDGLTYVHLFDGATDNVFVFEENTLRYAGSQSTPSLLQVSATDASTK